MSLGITRAALAVPVLAVVAAVPRAAGQPVRDLSTKVRVPSPTPTPAPKAAFRAAPALSADLAGRLHAAGLDPADPQIRQKLAGKHEELRRRLGSSGGGVTTRPLALGKPPGAAFATALPPGSKAERIVPVTGDSSAEIVEARVAPGDVKARLRVRSPRNYSPSDVSYRVTGPCGLDVSGRMTKPEGSLFCCFYDPDGFEWIGLSGDPQGPWKLGAGPRTVSLTLSAPGLPPASRTVGNVWGSRQEVVLTQRVDSAPPYFSASNVGMGDQNAKFGGTGVRSSTGTPWTPTSGEDVLGMGVFLGAGYGVSSVRIKDAHSQLDPPGYGAPENAYRYARIKSAPEGGRLQTTVQWMYGPAESLVYTIEWTLTGPMGQRALSIWPKTGPCDE